MHCDCHKVPDSDMVKLLGCTVDKSARMFYNEHVRYQFLYWRDTKHKFDKRYNGHAKQVEISRQLRSINYKDMGRNHILRIDASKLSGYFSMEMIEKVVERITTLTPLARRDDQTDYRRIEFLKKAIKNEKWALTAYGRISEDADFDEAVTSIKAALSDIVEIGGEEKHDNE